LWRVSFLGGWGVSGGEAETVGIRGSGGQEDGKV
jgi:hypothetical protein